jgi:UPF0271 protein
VSDVWLDLNADVGEHPAALQDGTEAELIEAVSSVNIACGGHAGDEATMAAVVALALPLGIAIGAHPSYPEREVFGRRALVMPRAALEAAIEAQTRALDAIVHELGGTLRHVKPHGALYNVAARDAEVASAIAAGLRAWRGHVWLVGLAGSQALDVWRAAGFDVAAEAFADRRYEADGSLCSRTQSDALLTEPEKAAAQALDIATGRGAIAVDGGRVALTARTLCLHGDTPGAASIAREVRARLVAHGVGIRPLPALRS